LVDKEDRLMIEAQHLSKVFGTTRAVDDVSFQVRPGEIYGFLGPNGAGKTTTIRMLTGTLFLTSGSVRVLGMDMARQEIEIKQVIGVVPDEPRLYENLKGSEYIDFVTDIYRLHKQTILPEIKELCEAFSIDFLDKPIGEYSHGMKQKLMLLSVLMRKPQALFLDEPSVGLDARSARILKMLLEKYAAQGAPIFMTTHIMEIAEKMCTRIAIINKGKLVAEGTMDELRKASGGQNASLEDIFLQVTGTGEDIEELVREL
jgi:ABC-2 type transport system ATP-binding protein